MKFAKVSVGSSYVKFKRKQFILNTFGKDITIHWKENFDGVKKYITLKNNASNWNDYLYYLSSGWSFLDIKSKKKEWTVMQRWRLKTIRGQNTLLHDNVWYLSGVFSPQYVVNASVDVFQRVLVCKMAAFVQLAVFDVVLDLVVYRQTSTVVDTPQIALLWVWSHRIVKDMADKLFVMIGVLLLIKRDLFTFSSGAEALYLKSWNKHTKKLCNHHSYRFHTPPGERCFS